MPYCTDCGHEVGVADRFCSGCGKTQPASSETSPRPAEPILSPRAASILSYVPLLGWIACIYVLASDKFRDARDVKFHAYQGLYLFVAWLLADWAVGLWVHMLPGPDIPFDYLLQLLILGLWIYMIVKTAKGERRALPVFGELAERSL